MSRQIPFLYDVTDHYDIAHCKSRPGGEYRILWLAVLERAIADALQFQNEKLRQSAIAFFRNEDGRRVGSFLWILKTVGLEPCVERIRARVSSFEKYSYSRRKAGETDSRGIDANQRYRKSSHRGLG